MGYPQHYRFLQDHLIRLTWMKLLVYYNYCMREIHSSEEQELWRLANRLHRVLGDLLRRYQLRDRDEICCHGVSVSQCYTLEALHEHGEMRMGELAARMNLKISSMTRVVDQLVRRRLARRRVDSSDRRVCFVSISAQGERLSETIRAELLELQRQVLAGVEPASREAVIQALQLLSQAVDQRMQDEATTNGRRT